MPSFSGIITVTPTKKSAANARPRGGHRESVDVDNAVKRSCERVDQDGYNARKMGGWSERQADEAASRQLREGYLRGPIPVPTLQRSLV